MICLKQVKRKLTKQELVRGQDAGWKQLLREKMAERKKINCKSTPVGLNNQKWGSRNNSKIDFIKNVKSSAKSNSEIDVLKNARPRVTTPVSAKNNVVDKKKIEENNSRNNNSNNSEISLIRNVKSTVTLQNFKNTMSTRKSEEKKIHSVTDIIKTVSSVRIKSGNDVKNNNAVKQNKSSNNKKMVWK